MIRPKAQKMIPSFHLSLGVSSIDTSVDFYCRVLMATVEHRDPSGYVNLDIFGSQITLKENPTIRPDLPDFHFGINLALNEFKLLYENIQAEDAQCLFMPPKILDPGTKLERIKLYVKCPTGYLIEIKSYSNSSDV